MPLISVITPCYNLGKYLQENIDSVKRLPEGLYEHIIIDDCSTDEETKNIIRSLREKNAQTIICNPQNKELANSLNTAIEKSSGKYIIVLSADDKLIAESVVEGYRILEEQDNISVVYGDAIRFGSEEGYSQSSPFNLQLLLIDNFIHASALYRRTVWEVNKGYDSSAPYMGLEDWEFWINSYKNKFNFCYLPQPFIQYRILQNSKIRTLSRTKARINELMEYIFNKHDDIVGAQLLDDFIIRRIKQNKLGYLYKWLLKAYFPEKFDRMCKKGKFRRYL